MQITHAFINPIPDDPAFLGTRPSHWNADHVAADIVNADISATAAIDESKLNLNFPTFDASLYLPLTSLPLSAANGGTGVANGASSTLTLPNFPITIAGGVTGGTYTLPATATGGTFALLNTANVFTVGQQITVPTATQNGLTLKSTDDNGTKSIFQVLSSTNAVKLYILPNGNIYPINLIFPNNSGILSKDSGGTQRDVFYASASDSLVFGATSGWSEIQFRVKSGTPALSINTNQGILKQSTANVEQFVVGGFSTQTLPVVRFFDNTAATNTVRDVLKLETQSTGTAAALGVGLLLSVETATNGVNTPAGRLTSQRIVNTNGSETSTTKLSAYKNSVEQVGLEVQAGTAVMLGMFGGTAAVQQVLAAYTSDGESAAYTGIDNLQVGTVYATVADLNQLRVAYENLKTSYDDLRAKLITSTLVA